MTATSQCTDCATAPAVARGRCKPCYRKHLRKLQAAGAFSPRPGNLPIEERLWGRAVAGPQSCIIWAGSLTKWGYGKIRFNGVHTTPHCVAYEFAVGPVPERMQVDHTCHNRDTLCPGGKHCLHRRCMNPHHLEAATARENTLRSSNTMPGVNARRDRCASGHLFTEDNTRIGKGGREGRIRRDRRRR
ncbi:HNH endonuclease signature motif containing protein [Streptomyces sp. BoleA5]|uniref:HNH endonuclease n=1 Tax=Streptomyces sp. BoleA5 TaxID=1157637 RepID=UPI000995E67B|nr:HNH endonuclease [Streptomyces sp. SID8377]